MPLSSLVQSGVLLGLASVVHAQVNPFDAGVQRYTVQLPEDVWEALQINARDEEWTPVQLNIGGQDIPGEVGMRFKGGVGTLEQCFQNDELVCDKLSIKFGFTKFDGPPYVDGIERLNLHSMIRDPTKMHEKISYQLYNDMGIVAPRTSYALLTVNGENLGLFSLVEQIEAAFIQRLGDQGEGQLYKQTWLGNSDEDRFEDGLKEGSSDHSPILAVQDDLVQATEGCRLGTLDQYFNATDLFKTMAVNDYTNHWDGPTAFYCNDEVNPCGNSNFYIYRSPDNNYVFIPWDMDNTMDASENLFSDFPHWLSPGQCPDRRPLAFNNLFGLSPGCDAFFQALAESPEEYTTAVDALLAGPVSGLEDVVEGHRSFLAEFIDEGTEEEWNAAVDKLKADVDVLRQKVISLKTV